MPVHSYVSCPFVLIRGLFARSGAGKAGEWKKPGDTQPRCGGGGNDWRRMATIGARIKLTAHHAAGGTIIRESRLTRKPLLAVPPG